MKLSRHIAVLALACCMISVPVLAASYTTVTTPDLFDAHGTLDKNTEITFTYTNNGHSPGSFLSATGFEGDRSGSALSSSLSLGSPSSHTSITKTSSGILEVLTAAALHGNSYITIENFTNHAVTFNALFAATRLAFAGTFSTVGPSPVPLPPAVALFAASLAGLVAFAMYRKRHEQI